MNHFLAESSKIYQNLVINSSVFHKVRIVMGNESCDLDSAISTLIYAYMLFHETKQKGFKNYEVLPLFNIPYEDLPLKTEVNYYLKEHKIDVGNIPLRGAREPVDLHKLHDSGILVLTLVDHHTLSAGDEHLVPAVVEVIDHRPQDPAWLWPHADVTIEPVGSCSTLITRKILNRCPHLLTNEVCGLLQGPIILDTFNFSEQAKRTTELDIEMNSALEKKSPVDRKQKFENLLRAKTDIAGLRTPQVLRKDMKVVGGLCVCGLPQLVVEFLRRPGAAQDVVDFLQAPALVLMGMQVNETGVYKDLAVVSKDGAVLDKLSTTLQTFGASALRLEEVTALRTASMRVFKQGNVTLSRKQIAPIIQKASALLEEVPQAKLR